jgi:hypothetical protein
MGLDSAQVRKMALPASVAQTEIANRNIDQPFAFLFNIFGDRIDIHDPTQGPRHYDRFGAELKRELIS